MHTNTSSCLSQVVRGHVENAVVTNASRGPATILFKDPRHTHKGQGATVEALFPPLGLLHTNNRLVEEYYYTAPAVPHHQ